MDVSPLLISIKTSCAAAIVVFFLGIAAAWFVAGCRSRLVGLIDSILTIPMVLPPTVVGFLLLIIFGKNGPIGRLLYFLCIRIVFSWTATVIAASVVSFPLMYRTARGAFEQVDQNLIYAARTLGISEWRIFWRVTVPIAWPGIAAGAVLSFARALGEFGATLMIAGNIPGKTQTIPIAIYFAAQNGEMGKAFQWVILILCVSFVIMILMNWWNGLSGKTNS